MKLITYYIRSYMIKLLELPALLSEIPAEAVFFACGKTVESKLGDILIFL